MSIAARSNWKMDPCKDFTNFSCGATKNQAKALKSAQEGVDTIMQRKWKTKLFIHYYMSSVQWTISL